VLGELAGDPDLTQFIGSAGAGTHERRFLGGWEQNVR
jgi:hypothetical protein